MPDTQELPDLHYLNVHAQALLADGTFQAWLQDVIDQRIAEALAAQR